MTAALSSNSPRSAVAIVFHLKLPQQQLPKPWKASMTIKDNAKHPAGRYSHPVDNNLGMITASVTHLCLKIPKHTCVESRLKEKQITSFYNDKTRWGGARFFLFLPVAVSSPIP